MIRRIVWAVWWLATLTLAAAADLLAGLPFTGPTSGTAGVIAAAGVCLVGYACAPHPGGAR